MKLISLIGISCILSTMPNIMSIVRYLVKPIVKKQCIITNKSGISYCDKSSLVFMDGDKFFKDKKMISISPGGFYGFYMMGVCTYIKENYNTSNYIFSGASAGAWNSLFMTLKTDSSFLKNILVKNDLYLNKNIFQLEWEMKNKILKYYSTRDFDLDRLFIGVTTFGQTNIYTDFENLDDALECCIASSHIPFITGSMIHLYKNKYTFDGGFSNYPYLNTKEVSLHINPNIWNQNEKNRYNLFNKDAFDIEKLFERGYEDTCIYGKETLDAKLKD